MTECSFCGGTCSDYSTLATNYLYRSVVEKHFGFEGQLDHLSICSICWTKVHDFNTFYNGVKQRACIRQIMGDSSLDAEFLQDEVVVKIEKNGAFDDDSSNIPSQNDDSEEQPSSDELQVKPTKKRRRRMNLRGAVGSAGVEYERDTTSPETIQKRANAPRIRAEDVAERFSLQCRVCDLPFDTFKLLQEHSSTTHGVAAYVECCGRKFNNITTVREHILFHRDPTAFRCTECTRSFSCIRYLNQHKCRTTN
ncbi:transcription factor grauzone-like [Anopheles aquasalis]|uniref:transcription factor grauzone-like n=1 Tax=Anopheles aquasalis TaxID=42839 RepID=UPI00215A467B|nr:transcription factor grauzone-like [Anopheles aquasalis]